MRHSRKIVASLILALVGVQPTDAAEFKRFHRDVKLDPSRQAGAGSGAGVRVGVIDTDIDLDHREFEDRVVEVIRDPDYPYLLPGNHGTLATGIIAAARDGRGMVGMAPKASIVSTWFLDDDGDRTFIGPGGSLTSWMNRLKTKNVNVINISAGPPVGSYFNSSDGLRALSRVSNSSIVAIAAGNERINLADVRCGARNREFCRRPNKFFGNVLVVGALKNETSLASFSNRPGNACFYRRPNGSCPKTHRLQNWYLTAPGIRVNSTLPGDRYGTLNGTSAATPIVSGAAALVMSQWPHLKRQPDQVARILLRSADDLGRRGVDGTYGRGRLNVRAALAPLGTTVLATGADVGGEHIAMSDTSFRASSAFGDPLSAFAAKEAVVFDDFGRDFAIDPAAFVNSDAGDVDGHDLFQGFMGAPPLSPPPVQLTSSTWLLGLAAEADPYGHLPQEGLMIFGAQGPVRAGFANDHDVSALTRALEGTVETSDAITAFRADANHLNLVGPARAFGGSYEVGGELASFGLMVAERSSAPDDDVLAAGDDAMGVELRSRLRPADGLTLHTRSGLVREQGSVLGTEGSGALALDGGATYYVGAGLSTALGGGFSLDLDLETGWIDVAAAGGSLLENSGRLRTETARLSLTGRDLWRDGDAVAIGVAQPLRVADGHLRVRLPVGRTPAGRVAYEEADLSAEPDGRELRVSLDYAAPLAQNAGRWQVSLVERLAPGHDPDRGAETLVFGKVSFAF